MRFFNSKLRESPEQPKVCYADSVESYQVIETGNSYTYNDNKDGPKRVIAASNNNYTHDLDISWLASASEAYDISPDINDYVLVDVPAVTIDVPNKNWQAFPYEEVTFFDMYQAKQVYQTFVGKPSCQEHDNKVADDTNRAKGVIFGATLQYIPTYDIYKIRLLQGFDRTKDPKLANEILTKKRNSYSMGSYVQVFICPICGAPQQKKNSCPHGKVGAGNMYNNHLYFSLCLGVVFFENSSVAHPADYFADGEVIS